MADSYFVALDEQTGTGRYGSGPDTEGPWDERLQHGGPPSALAVYVAERLILAETGRDDLVALRLAADFVRAVPVAEIEATARIVRAARSAALVEVTLAAGARDCLVSRVWFVRDGDTSSIAPDQVEPPPPVPDEQGALDINFGYGRSVDWRFVHGRMGQPGPAAAWARPRIPLIAGRELSGLARVALIADTASGISAVLDWSAWSFVNVDLDVHLLRPMDGEWVLLDAITLVGGHGSALARSTLSDHRGVVGAGLQTLVVGSVPTRK